MSHTAKRFARLLTQAIRAIAAYEHKSIQVIQDELGYALGKTGGASIERWRKGYIPAKSSDIERLVRELVRRRGLQELDELKQFLYSAGHPYPEPLLEQLKSLLEGEPVPGRQPLIQNEPPQNPFIAGPPIRQPRQFFGRAAELERLFRLWRQPPLQNAAVIGLRRSGKTSLLHYLQAITRTPPSQLRPGQRRDWLPWSDRYRWVFVDFQDPRMANRERLLAYLLQQLHLPAPAGCDLHIFMDIVAEHLQAPAVILMDEIGSALESPELDTHFWQSLRALGTNSTSGNLAFVLTAHDSPYKLAHDEGKTSSFFNIFGHTLRLGPLTEPEARELIALSPLPFAEADIDWLLVQSGRWPCLLQSLCHSRFTALEQYQSGEAWKTEALHQIEPWRHLLTATQ